MATDWKQFLTLVQRSRNAGADTTVRPNAFRLRKNLSSAMHAAGCASHLKQFCSTHAAPAISDGQRLELCSQLWAPHLRRATYSDTRKHTCCIYVTVISSARDEVFQSTDGEGTAKIRTNPKRSSLCSERCAYLDRVSFRWRGI